MRRTRSLSGQKVIVVHGAILLEESLPLPYVHYPQHYGCFIGFSREEHEYPRLCSCSKASVTWLKEWRPFAQQHYPPQCGGEVASSKYFPNSISAKSNDEGWDAVSFETGICHRCNQSVPSVHWCHSMYGGLFKQNYGWYIEQNRLKFGVGYGSTCEVSQNCPKELAGLAKKLQFLLDRRNHLGDTGNETNLCKQVPMLNSATRHEIHQLDKDAAKIKRRIDKFIEDETRKEFGFRKVGDGWVGESILEKLVLKIFPNENVKRCYRPDWLEGLELDVFVESKKLAFEYQGQQHYFPVKHWGGERALLELQERDRRKRKICGELGISLIEISFRDPLSEEYLLGKIAATKTKC